MQSYQYTGSFYILFSQMYTESLDSINEHSWRISKSSCVKITFIQDEKYNM